jgi:uncharacterized protein YbcI
VANDFELSWSERPDRGEVRKRRPPWKAEVQPGRQGASSSRRSRTGSSSSIATYYGKGPTGAKTYAINDTIICILKGGFTKVEETLMDDGKSEEVESLRRTFQRTMRDRFVEVVEKALPDRRVIGYMSEIHSRPHVAVELFLLAPADEPLLGEHEIPESEDS